MSNDSDSDNDSPPQNDGDNEDDISSSSSEEEDSEAVREKLLQFKLKLADNPFDYETHIQLIEFARKSGELDEVRAAREEMSKRFPLSPKIWLEWIADEKELSTGPESRAEVKQLFERAVRDYVSADLWLEYAQFLINDMDTEEGIKELRQVIEKGLLAVGLDASKGNLLFELLREVESALSGQQQDPDSKEESISKIFDVYRRQLSVPLLNMESTYAEFEDWLKESGQIISSDDVANVKRSYEKAHQDLQKMLPFEDSLISSEPPHIEEYKKYAEFAENSFNPATVQSVYERALTDNPLDQSLWCSYVNYLDRKVKIHDLSSAAYERAVRNCPWSSIIWCKYISSKERFGCEPVAVLPIFERSLSAGLPTGQDFREVWLIYIDFLRRHTDFQKEQDIEILRRTFNSAADHLASIEGADPQFSVLQYLSRVEAIFCKNMSNAREIWNGMMAISSLSSQSQLWMNFFQLEYCYGDKEEAKKILLKGMQNSLDWPESLGQLLLRIEREEGNSLEAYEKILLKHNQAMKKVNERRAKESEASTSKDEKKRAAPVPVKKRKLDERSDFKAPLPVGSASNAKKKKSAPDTAKTPSSIETPHYVKSKDSKSDADDLLTIFVSNLDFSVDDEKLRSVFSEFGELTDVRLVRNYKGKSKGFAYLQYSTIEAVRKALAHDRMKIDGRPAFISEMGKKKQFRYRESLEKHKLFVSNLHFDVDEAALRTVFEKYGTVKDIRIATYRNGHSKGHAYVEFEDELDAQKGLEADGMLLMERNIRVAISNPQQAKSQALGSAASSSTSSRGQSGRQRISAPFIPASVRRQMHASNGKNVP